MQKARRRSAVSFTLHGTQIAPASADKTIQLPHLLREPLPSSLSPGTENFTHVAPVFSGSSILSDDGWLTATGGLLFWVLPEHRLGLFRPSTLAIIGAHSTQLNMQHFVHGPQWTKCHNDL